MYVYIYMYIFLYSYEQRCICCRETQLYEEDDLLLFEIHAGANGLVMNLSEGKKIGHALLPKGTSGIARYDRDQEIIDAGENNQAWCKSNGSFQGSALNTRPWVTRR